MPDFDWVTARHECRMATVFVRLTFAARRDVAIRNGLPRDADVRFELVESALAEFTVLRHVERPGPVNRGVRFRHTDTELIVTVGGSSEPILTATLTLNDLGECRFKVNDVELEPWQVLRRSLERLFFT